MTSTVMFRGKLGAGLSGYASYSLRSKTYLKDSSQFDDHFVFEFSPTKFDLAVMADVVLPGLVDSLRAYRATLNDAEQVTLEWPTLAAKIEATGRDLDGRDGIHKLSPLAYYDDSVLIAELGVDGESLSVAAPDRVRKFRTGAIVSMPIDPTQDDLFLNSDRFIRSLVGR
ncbi:hypothetical protein [Variovorax paradoxus]|uniref:hypothetical protein n=1 Tax=Variovorax paradoxus TaxID=34073 RepID=UPI0012BC8FAC|nr:hypothetical protein [Variovorax paradoxus]